MCLNRQGQHCGCYERLDSDDWCDFSPFKSTLSNRIAHLDINLIDLTGNCLDDVMLLDEDTNSVIWHASLGKAGYAPEQRVQRGKGGPWMSSRHETIYMHCADMSGDGLADIVNIANGRVSYWPNLGFGSFASEVIMRNSPQLDQSDLFNTERIRFADIDGSSTTDLIYLPRGGGVHVYFNHAGNGWSERVEIINSPRLDRFSSVFVADLFGNGTACLCWTHDKLTNATAGLQYLHLTGGQKPYLLTEYTNGLGLQTSIKYRPSTAFHLEHESKGQPWPTRLPFPVHCVTQVKTIDMFAETSNTVKYAYHGGHYDGLEKEFCGFAMVEQ